MDCHIWIVAEKIGNIPVDIDIDCVDQDIEVWHKLKEGRWKFANFSSSRKLSEILRKEVEATIHK